jgi:His-Xaa-Ser system protein HxsD
MTGLEIHQHAPHLPFDNAGGPSVVLEVDLGVYSLEAVLRACYKLTDRCFLLLRRSDGDDRLDLFLQPKRPEPEVQVLLGELANELLDQQLRRTIAEEAGPVRELIVAQAFAEGKLLDGDRDEGDYEADPRGIGRRR